MACCLFCVAPTGEQTFLDGITAVSDIINLNLRYIANETSPGSEQFVCRHGPNECAGDILQLCVRSIYPETRDWFDFVVCMSKNASDIPMNGEECASQFDFDWSEIDSCTKNGQGLQLLQDSISYVHPGTNETISCTINMEQTFWCQHNEDWFGCTEGTTSEDFIRAVCKRYQGIQTPTVCQQYQQQQSTSITTTTEEEKETEREIPSTPSQTPAIALE